MIDPDMGTWNYAYDLSSNLLTQEDANSETTSFEYDALNRVTKKSYATASQEITYTYDNTTIGDNGIGKLHSVEYEDTAPDPDVITTRTYEKYDKMGRVTEESKKITGNPITYTTQYSYDVSGKLIQIVHPNQFEVDYVYYSGSNLLHTVTGSDLNQYAVITAYHPTGKIEHIEHQNEAATTYSYNDYTSRVEQILTQDASTQSIQTREYSYTSAGDIDGIDDGRLGITYTFGYDDRHRLTSESVSGSSTGSTTYQYDAIGNITYKSLSNYPLGNGIYDYTDYDPNHKHAVKIIDFNGTDYTYSYDYNGNMASGPDFTTPSGINKRELTYNADNMPESVVLKDWQTLQVVTSTDFFYDGEGVRAKKAVENGPTTYYVNEHFEAVLADPDDNIDDLIHYNYVYAGNLRIARISSVEGTMYYHKDHLGSSVVMTDEDGFEVAAETTDYRPFGSQRTTTPNAENVYKFTDQELDAESGLYNYKARLYDPVIGRFIGPDPFVQAPFDPQTLNRYSYCRNNPLIYTDPTGYGWGGPGGGGYRGPNNEPVGKDQGDCDYGAGDPGNSGIRLVETIETVEKSGYPVQYVTQAFVASSSGKVYGYLFRDKMNIINPENFKVETTSSIPKDMYEAYDKLFDYPDLPDVEPMSKEQIQSIVHVTIQVGKIVGGGVAITVGYYTANPAAVLGGGYEIAKGIVGLKDGRGIDGPRIP